MKKSASRIAFEIFNVVFMIVLCAVMCILSFLPSPPLSVTVRRLRPVM